MIRFFFRMWIRKDHTPKPTAKSKNVVLLLGFYRKWQYSGCRIGGLSLTGFNGNYYTGASHPPVTARDWSPFLAW